VGVKRRYKHFDWLHSELTRKFAFVVVPPLPGKQLTGVSRIHSIPFLGRHAMPCHARPGQPS
jgi:hypothetical protein